MIGAQTRTVTVTASTYGSSLARGTHQLRIRGYGNRKAIKSLPFEAGGHIWAVTCVFGRGDDHRLASVSLELLRTHAACSTDVVAMATVRIQHPAGEAAGFPLAEWRSNAAHLFPTWPTPSSAAMATCRTWELSVPDGREHRSWDDDYLDEGSWQHRFVDEHRCFYVYCAVDVLQEDSDRHPDQISVVPPPTISMDLGRLLLHQEEKEEGEGDPETEEELWRRRCMLQDATFIVEESEIRAHRLVLAMRSPVFAAEFRWHATDETLHVRDMTASTFRTMLHFIYTDELPPTKPSSMPAMALDLLVAADRYDIESLRLICENILCESMDATHVMPTLMVVHGRQSCRSLEAFCIQYMASDPDVYAAVEATEDYNELKESCCWFILDITLKVAKLSLANTPGLDAPSSSSSRQQHISVSMHNSSEVVVEGTHEFKIPHFIAVQARHGIGKEISSDTFHVGGYAWKVKVYPSSSSEEAKGHVSLYLELLTDPGTAGVKARACFKMICHNGYYYPSVKWLQKTFTTKSDWGYANFNTMQSVKSRYLAHDGSLTIHCHVFITKEDDGASSSTTTDGAMMSLSNDIISHLERLLVGEQGSDKRFSVEESEIPAHGLIIAMRSQILFNEIAMANKVNHVIVVNDMTLAVFKAMLHFIYTDELPHAKDLTSSGGEDEVTIAQDLLVVGCWFHLERMKAMCENWLARLISEENALSTLEMARELHCSNLEAYCSKFIEMTKLFRGRCIDFQMLNRFSLY